MRADLLDALAAALPSECLSLGREVAGVTRAGGGSRIAFSDGGVSDTFDLVIGADGIRSKVREAMFGPYAAKYSGIRIVFGCTGESDAAAAEARPEAEHGEVHQWFGDGCYTLVYTAGGVGRKQHNIAVCIADEETTDENPAWRRGDSDDARRACLDALKRYEMPRDAVAVAERCERFFDIGVHYHDPLDAWSDPTGTMVLAGDSCHAMPPFLGQGANQSLQDAWCIAKCVAGVGGRYGTVKEALEAYEAVRKPPTTQIMLSSRVIGFVETGAGPVGMVRDVAFGVLGAAGVAGKIFLKNAVPELGE